VSGPLNRRLEPLIPALLLQVFVPVTGTEAGREAVSSTVAPMGVHMRVTIAEVARRARVSKATVSRVLNDKADVDAATAIRVREVIAATGYIPSAGAVGLALGRTRTVGMLVPELTSPWIGEVLQGVADIVEAAGYGLLLHTMNRGADSLAQFARHVSANAFNGACSWSRLLTRSAISPACIIPAYRWW
jgi:transcriptional regulator with XRE-family HTH domain